MNNKKRSNLKVVTKSETAAKNAPKGQLVNTPSRTAEQMSKANSPLSSLTEAIGTQVFSSEEQALEVLVSQVVSRFEEDPEEQVEMREFLNVILETDPELRNEILSGVTIRR
jgi:hypothetical protein